jgi:hypothetical protein
VADLKTTNETGKRQAREMREQVTQGKKKKKKEA